jgi:hypothetical protein
MLPPIRSKIAIPDLSEEGRSNGHFLQDDRWLPAEEANQLMNGRDLDVVQRQPTSFSDVREQISELELRKRISMRAIEQRQIQAGPKAVERKGALGFAFHENHGVRQEVGMLLERGDGPVRTLDGERCVMLAEVRENNGAATAARFGRKLKRSAFG